MNKLIIAAAVAAAGFTGSAALAEGMSIGVSWASFQEERWKIDEAAMVAAIEAAGNTYVSADAESSSAKQLTDIEALITQGVDALVINAWDKDAIAPAIEAAANEGIPVIGYDRLIEDDRTLPDIRQYRRWPHHCEICAGGSAKWQLCDHQGRPRRSKRDVPSARYDGSHRRRC